MAESLAIVFEEESLVRLLKRKAQTFNTMETRARGKEKWRVRWPFLKNSFNWHCSPVFWKEKKKEFSKLLFVASTFWLQMTPNF